MMTFGDLEDGSPFIDPEREVNGVVYVKQGYGGKAIQQDRPELFVYFNDADTIIPTAESTSQ